MRIALIGDLDTRTLFEMDSNSTIPTQTPALNLARGLQELGGCDVHIVKVTTEVLQSETRKTRLGTVHRLPCPKGSGSISLFLWRRHLILRELQKIQPDVVHGQGTEREHAFTAVTSPFPHVITIHGVMARIHELFPPPWLSTQHVARWMERYTIQRARDVICISHLTEEFLVKMGCRARRHPIPNAMSPRFLGMERPSRSGTGMRLLFVGAIMERKGVGLIVEALPELIKLLNQPVELAVAGMGIGNHVTQLQARATELGVASFIQWVGPQDETGVADQMNKSDVLVLPSFVDNMPMCVGEAMAAAVPVIATTVGGIPQMVEHGKTGILVAPGNLRELTDALMRILSDPELRFQMGRAGREKAVREYAPNVVAAKTLDVYRQAITMDPSKSG